MAIKIRIPYNTTTGVTPTASNLLTGELAVNTADANMWVKHSNGSLVLITTPGPPGPPGTFTSDYRLKENVSKLNGGLIKILNLKPSVFSYKTNPNTMVDGFIAHEVQPWIPSAVTGEKDGDKIQTLDSTKIIPSIVDAIQELHYMISEIKNGN